MTKLKPLIASSRLERRGSLKDLAYQNIKGLLLDGKLEPERLYSAQHFAQLLGVSRTPVREALLRLTNEGFLVCREVKGFKVRQFSTKEIRDVFETRRVIEAYVVRRLTDKLSPDNLRQLRQFHQRMTECAAKNDSVGFIAADREFHMYLVHSNGNAHLASIMDDIRCHIALFGLKALTYEGRFQEVIAEHARILEALRRKDAKKGVQAMRDHLAATRKRLIGPRKSVEE